MLDYEFVSLFQKYLNKKDIMKRLAAGAPQAETPTADDDVMDLTLIEAEQW
jgi:hypothetical protein